MDSRWIARKGLSGMLLGFGIGALGCACDCFVAGTRVATPNGDRAIEDLKIGETVFSFVPDEGLITVSRVLKTYIHEKRPVRRLKIGQDITHVTDGHPYFTVQSGFLPAGHLGDAARLLRLTGSRQLDEVPCSSLGARADVTTVYNLHVDGPSTYFANGIGVHNKSPLPLPYVPQECCIADDRCLYEDHDWDGVRYELDCDDETALVGECGPSENRVDHCDRYVVPDAGADGGSSDSGPSDGG